MSIPTEPVGSIPRPPELVAAMQQFAAGRLSRDQLARLEDAALRDTIKRFEATEAPVISDGEQSKPSFGTYPIHGLASLAPDGVTIPFADGRRPRRPGSRSSSQGASAPSSSLPPRECSRRSWT